MQEDGALSRYDTMMLFRELYCAYFKLTSGDKIHNLQTALNYCMKALVIAQEDHDPHMSADLKGKLGSCSFELGVETDSVNLVHEAISYSVESAQGYASLGASNWQQQAMGYGCAAYYVEALPDADSRPNIERRIRFYELMLGCVDAEAPKEYVDDIHKRLNEARKLQNKGKWLW